MIDYIVPKPASLGGYPLHRMAEGLTQGGRPLYTDFGDHLVLRCAHPIAAATARPVRSFAAGDLLGFELRACVSRKVKGHHRYFPVNDWRSRHEWLSKQGAANGFVVITVHCTSCMARVDKGHQSFTVDQTDFTGVLKVVDEPLFRNAMLRGVGSTARAFGFGMINI